MSAMTATVTSALAVWRSVQWRPVLVLTLFLLSFHLFFLPNTAVTNVTSQPQVPADQIQSNIIPPPNDDLTPADALDGVYNADGAHGAHGVQTIEHSSATAPVAASSTHKALQESDLAVCIAVKDQADDLIEFFVHHYHQMGIKRFYIMDDGSKPPLSDYEYPGIPREVLTFKFWPDRVQQMQLNVYRDCMESYGSNHTWMAFLDADELLETPGEENLAEVLESFEDEETVGALGVNWKIHSSAGLLKRPESARKAFTTCLQDKWANGDWSDNEHIKSIVKMSKAGLPINPHKFSTQEGSNTVGENGDVIDHYAFRTPPTRDRIALHHYCVKSREEFEAKMLRGNGMTDPKSESLWTKFEYSIPHEECTEMVVYEP